MKYIKLLRNPNPDSKFKTLISNSDPKSKRPPFKHCKRIAWIVWVTHVDISILLISLKKIHLITQWDFRRQMS